MSINLQGGSRLITMPTEIRMLVRDQLLGSPEDRVMKVNISSAVADDLASPLSVELEVPWTGILACKLMFTEARSLLNSGIVLDVQNPHNRQVRIEDIIESEDCLLSFRHVIYAVPEPAYVNGINLIREPLQSIVNLTSLRSVAIRRDNLDPYPYTKGRVIHRYENLRAEELRRQSDPEEDHKLILHAWPRQQHSDWANLRPFCMDDAFSSYQEHVLFLEYAAQGAEGCGGTCATDLENRIGAEDEMDEDDEEDSPRGSDGKPLPREDLDYEMGWLCNCGPDESSEWHCIAFNSPHKTTWEFVDESPVWRPGRLEHQVLRYCRFLKNAERKALRALRRAEESIGEPR
jgi:hypothetical protein